MVVCVFLPRFELAVAAGREALARGPMALAPEPGREQLVGEVSAAAEAFGVHPGTRLGEALARCPRLELIPPDPVGVAAAWEGVITRLEGMGAAVELGERPGICWFDASGLLRLHGGLDGVLGAARAAIGAPARLGVSPCGPFAALVGALRARSRRAVVIGGPEELATAPVGVLRREPECARLPEGLEQLGIGTLGALAALPPGAVGDRFGMVGTRAWALARGDDRPLRPRTPGEVLHETLELPEASSGTQLDRALDLLIDRVLARRERRGRTIRAVVLSARLIEGGTWRDRVVFRESLADPRRMRLALGGRTALLPAPAETLRLAVDRFGPPHRPGAALFEDDAEVRRGRLREAVRQARAAAGPDAALRVLTVDPDSRVPERRAVLAPYE